MAVEIVPATLDHVVEAVKWARARERAAKPCGKVVATELARSFIARTALVSGNVGAIYGVRCSGILCDEAYIWLFVTQNGERAAQALLRQSVSVVRDVRGIFRRVYGYVDADFEQSLKWLKWLGASVGPEERGLRMIEWIR